MTTSAVERGGRAAATREIILTTAEMLFAERGVHGVSNRQISEAAGQGNNAAVGYHFGTKSDLVRAILRRHSVPIEERRRELVAECNGSTDIRDWLTCLIRPTTEHLAALGSRSWFARFGAQISSDPELRALYEDVLSSPHYTDTVQGLTSCIVDVPEKVQAERRSMARQVLIPYVAEIESALAEQQAPDAAGRWYDCGTDLIDALAALLTAPVSPSRR